jgi:ABC-type nitrate/sulfonate/bicarbonate transport system permease component
MFAAIFCVVIVAFFCDRALLVMTRRVLVWHESGAFARESRRP